MAYSHDHWEQVADQVNKGLTPEQVQDHFPDTTVKTVKLWIRKCEVLGLVKKS